MDIEHLVKCRYYISSKSKFCRYINSDICPLIDIKYDIWCDGLVSLNWVEYIKYKGLLE